MDSKDIRNQHDFMRYYNDKHREQFNPELFLRDEDEVIHELKKVILSCERSKYFTIKVLQFSVVEDYNTIRQMLKEQERFKTRSRNKSKIKLEDKYNYITLKDSKIKLLVVDYYIEVPFPKEEEYRSKKLRVLIEIPKIVNKYYLKIFGNEYSVINQIVDGSTYNNSQASNAKTQSVAFKTLFMASRFYRYNEYVKTVDGETRTLVYYHSRIFNKGIPMLKYLLARFGLYGCYDILHVVPFTIGEEDPKDEHAYTFKKTNIYISCPKYILNRDPVAQSLLYTLMLSINKNTTVEELYTRDYWLMSLGSAFNNETVEKGYRVLDSLESIYDLATREALQLPDEYKQDIYDVLVWIVREFSSLRRKDNLDISIKRIRYAEYFAALYALKLSTSLYRISEMGNKIQLIDIEKAIYTFPDYLIRQITKDRLINYKNSVNDIDAFQALKYTFKGVQGVGDESGSSIPTSYRQAHPSHLTRVDIDSSTANDPGLSGLLCPLSEIHNNLFSEYDEPNDWREQVDGMIKKYRELAGLKEAIKLQKDIGMAVKDHLGIVDESIDKLRRLMEPVMKMDDTL